MSVFIINEAKSTFAHSEDILGSAAVGEQSLYGWR